MKTPPANTRINARLTGPLAVFLEQMTGPNGLYETPSEYIRDLIRRDMEQQHHVRQAIIGGYQDVHDGAVFQSTGNFDSDMAILATKERQGW